MGHAKLSVTIPAYAPLITATRLKTKFKPKTALKFKNCSHVFSTVSALALGTVQPVSTSGATLTTHCAFVETPNPCHTL